MVDIVDHAKDLEDLQRELTISAKRIDPNAISAHECDCGVKIPEERRRLLPGVQNCVDCQEQIERGRRWLKV